MIHYRIPARDNTSQQSSLVFVCIFGPELQVTVYSAVGESNPGPSDNAMPQVFQYGSNCDEARLNAPERLAGDALNRGRAQTLDEYEIAFDIWSQRNACAASNLVLVAGTGQRSWGVLYEIPADLIRGSRTDGRRTLSQIEGNRYEERPIRVRNADGEEVMVTTFLVRPDEQRPGLWTSFKYVQHIVNGLRRHEVPEEYVQRV